MFCAKRSIHSHVCHTVANTICMLLSLHVKDSLHLTPNDEQFISRRRCKAKRDILYPSPDVQHVLIKTSFNISLFVNTIYLKYSTLARQHQSINRLQCKLTICIF